MTITFRPAKRENVPLLLGVAGGTGSGKTYSALRLARGLAAGRPFAGIDTENERMNHYADAFPELQVGQIRAPFRPETYTDAVLAAEAFLTEQNVPRGHRVIVIDSMSHEWSGDGGCLDWHAELTKGDARRNQVAWATVKPAHKRMVTRLLQIGAHVIVCLRAEQKYDVVEENGKTKYVAKKSLTGLDGWIPVTEKNFPYELTASFLLTADRPGFPQPIKLEEQHKPFVPLDEELSETVGVALGEWASGESGAAVTAGAPGSPDAAAVEELEIRVLELANDPEKAATAIEKARSSKSPAELVAWLNSQVTRLERSAAA